MVVTPLWLSECRFPTARHAVALLCPSSQPLPTANIVGNMLAMMKIATKQCCKSPFVRLWCLLHIARYTIQVVIFAANACNAQHDYRSCSAR